MENIMANDKVVIEIKKWVGALSEKPGSDLPCCNETR